MLLNEMIRSLRLERKDVYIANILKCRPPRNRDPLPLEIDLCTPYLKKQIALLKPKIIIAVGRVAAHHLLNTEESMGRLRGRQYTYGDFATPLFVIYHPAYLLRSPSEKGKAYEDLKHIYKFLQNKL
jgi:DNA polymerase